MQFQAVRFPNWSLPTLLPKGTGVRILWSWSKRKKISTACAFMQGGLKAMKEAIKDADDQAIIDAFHDAWRLTMRALV